VPLQKPQNRGIAFDTASRTGWRECARYPGVAIAAVDPKHVVVVLTRLRRGGRVDAVAITEMPDQTFTGGLMKYAGLEFFEAGERPGVALTRFLGVAAEMACDICDREGKSPSPMELLLGRCSTARRLVCAVTSRYTTVPARVKRGDRGEEVGNPLHSGDDVGGWRD